MDSDCEIAREAFWRAYMGGKGGRKEDLLLAVDAAVSALKARWEGLAAPMQADNDAKGDG